MGYAPASRQIPGSFALFPRYFNANFSLSESSSLLALGAEALDLASNSHNPTVIAESLKWPKIERSGENRYPFRRPAVRGFRQPQSELFSNGAAIAFGLSLPALTHALSIGAALPRIARLME